MTGIQVYDMIKKHLQGVDFSFDEHREDLAITLTVHGDDLPIRTIIRVLEDKDVVSIRCPMPGHIDEDKRMEMAVAVTVANYGMINGGFQMDMSDGELTFNLSQTYRGMQLSDEAIRYMLGIAFNTTDKYNDRFFMLNKGVITLEKFIEMENNG